MHSVVMHLLLKLCALMLLNLMKFRRWNILFKDSIKFVVIITILCFFLPTHKAHWEQHELQGQLAAKWLQFVYWSSWTFNCRVLFFLFCCCFFLHLSLLQSVSVEMKHRCVMRALHLWGFSHSLPKKEKQSLILLEGSNHHHSVGLVWTGM